MSEAVRPSSLPEPAPGFAGLVAIHLHLLVRDARLGTAIIAALCVALPVTALFTAAPGPNPDLPLRIHLLTFAAMGLTGFLAFLWPESVWRGIGPGRRLALDALPVSRRSHRMARVVAGTALPLVLLGSLLVTWWILEFRGMNDAPPINLSELPGLQGAGIVATVLWILTAYALSSVLALRFGKVFLGLLVIVGVVYLVPLIMLLGGFEDAVNRLGTWAIGSPFSPFGFLTRWYQLTGADVLPGIAWLGLFGGISVWLAGRHDKA